MAKQSKRKKAFVAKADRPTVNPKSTARLSDLTVRDLATVLGQFGTRKDFWDGKDWQKDDFDNNNIKWKDSKEGKDGKDVKDKEKEKDFKEKREIKELKLEKIETDGTFEPGVGPDPRIEQVIGAVAGLSAKVDQLADQVAALKKKG
jgi:hypothetical protein